MTNKLLLAAIAFGLWANAAIWLVDQCKHNRINSLAASSRSRRSFVS